MDPLSDVLRAVRLDGAFFYLVEGMHPWSVQSGPAVELTPRVLPGAEHLISYHIVTEGSCWGGLIGEPVMDTAGNMIGSVTNVILSDDADAIAAFEQRQRRESPWLQLDDGRMDRLFPVSKE